MRTRVLRFSVSSVMCAFLCAANPSCSAGSQHARVTEDVVIVAGEEIETETAGCVVQLTDGRTVIISVVGGKGAFGAAKVAEVGKNGNSVQWGSFVNENSRMDAVATGDGGLVVCGGIRGGNTAGGSDMFVFRADASLSIVWETLIGGPAPDWANAVVACKDGGFIVCGMADLSQAGARRTHRTYVASVSEEGKLRWEQKFDIGESSEATSVVESANGDAVISGWTEQSNKKDAYLLRIDRDGKQLWTRTYGGSLDDVGNSVIQDEAGGFLLCGWTESRGEGAHKKDLYLAGVGESGSIKWERALGGAENEEGVQILGGIGGGALVIGRTSGDGGKRWTGKKDVSSASDIFIMSIDAHGEERWAQRIGSWRTDVLRHACQVSGSELLLLSSTQPFRDQGLAMWFLRMEIDGDKQNGTK